MFEKEKRNIYIKILPMIVLSLAVASATAWVGYHFFSVTAEAQFGAVNIGFGLAQRQVAQSFTKEELEAKFGQAFKLNAAGQVVQDPAARAVLQQLSSLGSKQAQDVQTDINRTLEDHQTRVENIQKEQWKEALGVTYKNLMFTFTGQLAQDLATFIVTGDRGKALIFGDNWQDYLRKASLNAAADSLHTFASSTFGVDICVSPLVKAKLTIGLAGLVNPKRGKVNCTWDKLLKSWDVESPDFLKNFAAGYDIDQSVEGIVLSQISTMMQAQSEAERNRILERQNSKIFKDKETPVSRKLLTPGEFIRKEYSDLVGFSEFGLLAGRFTSSWAADTLNLFTTTLVQEFLKKMKTGYWTLADLRESGSLFDPVSGGASTTFSAALASKFYAKFAAPDFVSVDNFDVIQEMVVCPVEESQRTLWNCVLDGSFSQALQTTTQDGSRLTIREAVERDLLHAGWPFGYTDPGSQIEPNYNEGYAYSNMIKLRRARIIPVGWELAAKKIGDQLGYTVTLAEVMSGFNNVNSPFYKMVDPEWLLRPPVQDCRIETFGQLTTTQGSRDRYCADIRDCVVESEDGSCKAWGYCTKEKNVFKFRGDSCDERFASCKKFVRTADSTEFHYLENTVTKNGCNVSNAGCSWYSQTQDANGAWIDQNRIYLNRAAENCSSQYDGCKDFLRLTNYFAGNSVENIARTVLSDANKQDTYANYATVEHVYLNKSRLACSREEAGCNLYTPQGFEGAPITAVAQARDVCPSECVGYNSFTQDGNYFERSQFPVYFIPTTGTQCRAEVAGCSQFTNLDALARGGEATEYFSYLRQCQKPFEDNPANQDCAQYITWKGSEIEGFQIESFLLKSVSVNASAGEAGNNGSGAPGTTDDSTDCNDRNSPDCKQFYDVNGNIYYRDFSKTISCQADCNPFRKSESTQADCEATNGFWDPSRGGCIYQAIRSQALVCGAQENGCRAYRGNTSDNRAQIAFENFEGDNDRAKWAPLGNIFIASEATTLGGHSLSINDTASYAPIAGALRFDKDYIVEVFLKNSVTIPTRIAFKFGSMGSDRSNDVVIGSIDTYVDSWNRYQIGQPLRLTRQPLADEALIIEVRDFNNTPVNSVIYIDDLKVIENRENIYLIKNSWKTPNSCETEPPLTGGTATSSMVGCQAYKNKDGVDLFFKSFSRLCASDKVGCEALIDTQNSSQPFSQSFQTTDPSAAVEVLDDKVAYFVNDPAKYCPAEEKGCSALGLPKFTQTNAVESFATVYKRHDPDRYDSQLCLSTHQSCQEYSSDDNTFTYFKDPAEKVCEYRALPGTIPPRYAWFKKGDSITPNPPECVCEFLDRDETTSAWYRIDDFDNTPNPLYCTDFFGSATDNPWVRTCGANQAGCTEFIQPLYCERVAKGNRMDWYKKLTDPENPERCERYYYLNDQQLDRSSCNGQVDWKNGCVLFNDTSQDRLLFKTGDNENYVGVSQACNANDPGCNANILLKVRRDRSCGEWLACQSSQRIFDRLRGNFRDICYAMGTCIKAKEGDQSSECAQWKRQVFATPLDDFTYQSRVVGWTGLEYSGFSIPNEYPLTTLRQVPYSVDAQGIPSNFRLTYMQIDSAQPANGCNVNADCPGENKRCVNRLCYDDKGIDGTGQKRASRECRGYPEESSPFPSSNNLVLYDTDKSSRNYGQIISRAQAYTNARFAYFNEDADCDYQQIRYEEGDEKYFSLGSAASIFELFRNGGTPLRREEVNAFFGWRGYCLERDPKRVINNDINQRACLTWYPVDLINGEVDVYNTYASAGYIPDIDKQFYCIESKLAEKRSNFDIGCQQPEWTDVSTFAGFALGALLSSTGAGALALNSSAFLGGGLGFGIGELFDAPASPLCPQGYYPVQTDDCGGGVNSGRGRQFDCRPVFGEGWYDEDGVDAPLEIHSEVCTKVARIASPLGQNTSLTSNIFDLPGGYTVPVLEYAQPQPNGIYGSSKPMTGNPNENLWGPNPLQVIDRKQFADCAVCVPDVNGVNRCFGEEGDPDNGKFCPIPANAGSPYACFNNLCPNLSIVKNADGENPYKEELYTGAGRQDFTAGISRISNVFAKSYGVWNWNVGTQACLGSCVGGAFNGRTCVVDSHCQADVQNGQVKNYDYTCSPNTCTSGNKAGAFCNSSTDCLADGDGLCNAATLTCTNNGRACVSNQDCMNFVRGRCNKKRVCDVNSGFRRQSPCETDEFCKQGNTAGACVFQQKGSCESDDVNSGVNGIQCDTDLDCRVYYSGVCSSDIKLQNDPSKTVFACRGATEGLAAGNICDPANGIAPNSNRDCQSNGECGNPLCSDGVTACTREQLGQSCGQGYSQYYERRDCPDGQCILNTANGRYECDQDTIPERRGQHCIAWDYRFTGGPQSLAEQRQNPVVRQTVYNPVSKEYAEGAINKFSMNNRTAGDLVFYGGASKGVLITFYSYNENGQHMPLRRISIDWKDGEVSNSYGSFKNHKHACAEQFLADGVTPNPAFNFGDAPDACVQDTEFSAGYFSYVHVFYCDRTFDRTQPYWDSTYPGGGACIFTPVVTVWDNWEHKTDAEYDGRIIVLPAE